MASHSNYTDKQKRDAAKRVLIGRERREDVGKELGVSSNSVGNWIKRFGHELASDAMDAAAGKPTKAPKAIKLKPPKITVKRAAQEQPEAAQPVERTSATLLAHLDRDTLSQLGLDLGEAVRFIADKNARNAVAEAAFLLTQAAGNS